MTGSTLTETIEKNERSDLSIGERLKLYEKLETSLRNFFNSTNFCEEHCFSKEEAIVGWQRSLGNITAPGNGGCCHNEYKKFYNFAQGLDSTFDKNSKTKEIFQQKQLENIKEDFC